MRPLTQRWWMLPLGLWLACASAARAAVIDDRGERAQLRAQVEGLLMKDDFKGLEALVAGFRSEMSLFTSGDRKLQYFYECIARPDNEATRAPEEYWEERLEHVKRWRALDPTSVPALITEAQLWTFYAWRGRGGGYANEVHENGWGRFGERLKKAEAALDQIVSAGKEDEDPQYYPARLHWQNSAGSSKDEILQTLVRSKKRWQGYPATPYFASWGLLPQWGGGKRLGQLLRQELKEDPESAFYMAIWDIDSIRGAGSDSGVLGRAFGYGSDAEFWQAMRPARELVEKRYGNSVVMLNRLAVMAFKCGQSAEAARYFEKLGDREDPKLWHGTFANRREDTLRKVKQLAWSKSPIFEPHSKEAWPSEAKKKKTKPKKDRFRRAPRTVHVINGVFGPDLLAAKLKPGGNLALVLPRYFSMAAWDSSNKLIWERGTEGQKLPKGTDGATKGDYWARAQFSGAGLNRGKIYYLSSLSGTAKFVALKAVDGKLLWKKDLVRDKSYASPIGPGLAPRFGGDLALIPLSFPGGLVMDLKARKQLRFIGKLASPDIVPGNKVLEYDQWKERLSLASLRTGKAAWTFQFPKGTLLVGAVFDKKRVFVSTEDYLVCLDIRDGRRLWLRPSDSSSAGVYQGPLLLGEGRLYSYFGDDVQAMDPKDGRTLWRSKVKGQIVGPLALKDGGLYFTPREKTRSILRALDASTGKQRWTSATGIYDSGGLEKSSVTFAGGRLILLGTDSIELMEPSVK